MEIGNIVMFTDDGTYAKYFFGQLAEVVSSSISKSSGKEHVRVKWKFPVKYFDKYSTISDFEANKFTLVSKL
jgi:hypothetical protein